MIQLIDLLKITDPFTEIVLWVEGDVKEEGPSYRGTVAQVPWGLSEYYLYRGLNDNLDMIGIGKDEDYDGALVVSITDSPKTEECSCGVSAYE